MKEIIHERIRESIAVKEKLLEQSDVIARIAEMMISSYQKGGKLIIFGNGGSAADAQHIAAELVNKFEKERRSLPAIALHTNTSSVTAQSNDHGFDSVFSRQVEGFCMPGDVVVGISTSGNSASIAEGLRVGKEKGGATVLFTGESGGKMHGLADIELNVPSRNTARIQESHITAGHIICGLVEDGCSREEE
ncbi:phosphoheptose isomerase [Candidatus Woesearchaeota archaeon]|nr:phosphoheptose isomerase [Candidatus Woesearchaeota archaeon]